MQTDMLKIWRFPYSTFGGIPTEEKHGLSDETVTADKIYDDNVLSDIAASGFNAIWVHGLLHNLVNVSIFPELGRREDVHLEAMRNLIKRAKKHGLRVFLYMQPPRALPASNTEFWEKHLDVWGQEETARSDDPTRNILLRSFCTSVQKVKDWIELSYMKIGKELVGLGGIILIMAGEFPGYCYSRRRRAHKDLDFYPVIECPRCVAVEPEEVATEIITLIEKGLHSSAPETKIIVWNWGWNWKEDSQAKMIGLIPDNVILMADFERGGRKDLPGKKGHLIDEYALSYSGPSEKFIEAYSMAKEKGLEMFAKLQLGTTHELASVVSLPLLGNIFEKADYIRKNKLAGFMGCWNFGNFTSSNTIGFNFFLGEDRPREKSEALANFAASYFEGCDSKAIVDAWFLFQESMEYFPYSVRFLYGGIQNFVLSYQAIFEPGPLKGEPAGRSWVKESSRGDDFSSSIVPDFPLDDIIYRMEKLTELWDSGCRIIKSALAHSKGQVAQREYGNAMICRAIWRSCRRAYRLYPKIRHSAITRH